MRHSILIPGAALLLGACAAAPPAPQADAAPSATVASSQPPIGCVNSTGTRLPVKPTDCVAFGSVHSRAQINTTGAQYAQQPLQMLDTAVTPRGNVAP